MAGRYHVASLLQTLGMLQCIKRGRRVAGLRIFTRYQWDSRAARPSTAEGPI